MYRVGEKVVYGETGVCVVSEITKRKDPGTQSSKLYYTLKPIYQTCVIYTPVEGNKVFMRPVISKKEAMELIDSIPSKKALRCDTHIQREVTENYEKVIRSHDCGNLIELTKLIYEKRENCKKEKKKFSSLDERFMKRAENLLFGEFAVALDIEKDDVVEYISDRIGVEQ